MSDIERMCCIFGLIGSPGKVFGWRRFLLLITVHVKKITAIKMRAKPPITPPTMAPIGVLDLGTDDVEVLGAAPVKSACPVDPDNG